MLYAGITGLLVLPLMLILSICLHFVGWVVIDQIEITIVSIGKFGILMLLLAYAGVVIGGIVGLCYGIMLKGIKKFVHRDYPDTCRTAKRIGQILFVISLPIFVCGMSLVNGKTSTAIVLFVYTPVLVWVLLVPFILLNRKLIHLFE